MRIIKKTVVLAAWLALVLHVTASNAQDAGMESIPDADASSVSVPDSLVDVFMGDARERVASAEEDLLAAQANSDGAAAGGTATEGEIAALEASLLEAQAALAGAEADVQAVIDLLAQLNEEQVAALTRSLNNAFASGLTLALDAALLQQMIDGSYDKHQINALVQGFEQEARFLAKRDRFAAREAELRGEEATTSTGHMERMEAKAASQKEKFLAKVEDAVEPEPEIDTTADDSVDDGVEAAVDDAVDAAIEEAAKSAAKESARDTAKQIAKKEARLLAKATAEETVKESGKSATSKGKGHTK